MPNLPKAHTRPWLAKTKSRSLKPHEGRKVRSKFYGTMPWRKFRAHQKEVAVGQTYEIYKKLVAEGIHDLSDFPVGYPLCAEMLKTGRYVQAKYLDHIKPINPGNAYDTKNGQYGDPLSVDNVQWLCVAAHARKSGREHKFHKNI